MMDNSPVPMALIIHPRTYMRRQTIINERVVKVMPTAAMVGALVAASGLTVLYVQPISQSPIPGRQEIKRNQKKMIGKSTECSLKRPNLQIADRGRALSSSFLHHVEICGISESVTLTSARRVA